MAKKARRRVNKSQKIRDVLLGEQGIDASPKAVMEILKASKISVTAAQVSNVKAALRLKQGKNGARPRGGATGDQALLSAFQFVRSVGSLSAARKALEEVASLR